MFELLVTTCWRHVLQIHVVWLVSEFLIPNQSQTMEIQFPIFSSASWGSASVSISDVTLLVMLVSSSIALSSFSAMLLFVCLLPSDRCHKRVLAGDVKMQPQSSSVAAVTSYNEVVLNSKCGYPTVIPTLSCALHAILNHNRNVR